MPHAFPISGGYPDSRRHPRLVVLASAIQVWPFEVSWVAMPGRSNASVCLLLRNFRFSGDILIGDWVGRTDLPSGDRDKLVASIRKLMELPGDVVVSGGHGPRTNLGAESSPGTRVWRLFQ